MARSKRSSGIKVKKANAGKLRATTGTPAGKKIPVATLRQLKNSTNPTTRKRATFALNARTKFRTSPAKKS